ncbi:MAG: class I SAM-dependent methyltransferase [Oscillospiraceae bacterium]|nr:class I SAM-dependent methyltransferase [Oscillospiraceae bacterium]
MDTAKTVKEYYNSSVEAEWNRIAGRPEFLLTCRFLDKYIKPGDSKYINSGDSVLDIGGGPGRYSLYLSQKGCNVTLFDLSDKNIEFAKNKADELNLKLNTICGDAREADSLVNKQFDYILLMGPMYHLLEEEDRIKAVNSALKLLKPNGIIFVSFISVYGGLIYMTKCAQDIIISEVPMEINFRETVINRRSYSGEAFTLAHFIQMKEILPFMERFPLEKLHLFGQEGIMTLNEDKIMSQPQNVIDAFVDFSLKVCENEELLSWSEHLMYVGRKKQC